MDLKYVKKQYETFVGIPVLPTIVAIALGYYLITMPFLKTSPTTVPAMLVIVILAYYIKYVFKMIFNKEQRIAVSKTNTRLEELRCIPNKTMEEQKEFLNLKYPKSPNEKWKFSWEWLNRLLFTLTIYIMLFKIFKYILFISNISISWFWAIIFMVLFPLALNIILGKFGVEKSDISIFFRGGKRK